MALPQFRHPGLGPHQSSRLLAAPVHCCAFGRVPCKRDHVTSAHNSRSSSALEHGEPVQQTASVLAPAQLGHADDSTGVQAQPIQRYAEQQASPLPASSQAAAYTFVGSSRASDAVHQALAVGQSRYTLSDPSTWLAEAPRVRIRSAEDRKLEELVELTVLNERLSGRPSWAVRRRLEYLKLRRRNWEAIYHYINETDAVATLALIEEANRKVEQALSEEAQQRMGVGELQQKLLGLHDEVNVAAEKLQQTQARVTQNLKRVNQLKAEAATLERLRTGTTKTAPASSQTASGMRKDRGLKSTLEIEDALREFWYPAEFSKTLAKDMLVPIELFGENWVLFRDENGHPACIKDTCAHRACPLSLGKIDNGQVVCAYHGWQFNGDGHCTKMPSTAFCRNVAVAALPCAEKDGFVWIWPGRGIPPDELPGFTAPPPGFDVHAEIMVDVPVEHGLLVENLLDLAHAPFTHTSTFARGWPIPDAVRFHATKMLSGNWDPYPSNMSFQPPCATVSMIGLAQPGKIMRGVTADKCTNHLHQLHVCMPAKKGHTRLLYRMSMDFMGWARFIPGIQDVWKKVAAQVLGEDLVLVLGQQDRMKKGEDTWANPMAYDKLAVRYRRWRNSVAAGDLVEGERLAAQASMSAGELFRDEDAATSDVSDDTAWLNAQQLTHNAAPPSSVRD